jgi:hypothetical protein
VVDVDHQDPERVFDATTRPHDGDQLVEVAAVRQAGQRVDVRTGLGLLVRIGPREGRGDLAGGPVQSPFGARRWLC